MIDLLDTFHGVNGTHLAAHAPDIGGTWVDDAAGWQLSGNELLQTVDANKSHIEFSDKVLSLEVDFQFNGCDPNNLLTITLGDDPGNNLFEAQLGGSGSASYWEKVATVQPSEYDVFAAPAIIVGAGVHVLYLNWGPDLLRLYIDGAPVLSIPRTVPKNMILTRFTLLAGALNALPGWKLSRVQVGQ